MDNKRKEIYWERIVAGVVYLFFSGFILNNNAGVLNGILDFFHANAQSSRWCVAFSSLGIGIGLINTRNHKTPSDLCFCINWVLHFVGYFGFVLVLISLAAFILGAAACGTTFDFNNPDPIFYPVAAFIGLVGGFLGYSLQGFAEKIVEKLPYG